MRPIKFKECNASLLKPENMTDEECETLYAFKDGKVIVSCWRLGLLERLQALFTGKVWLWVHSPITMPPVSLTTVNPFYEVVEPKEKLS